MATKTAVCPECGAAAAPGRYACAECGALLASVAVAPRTWSAEGDEVRPGHGGTERGRGRGQDRGPEVALATAPLLTGADGGSDAGSEAADAEPERGPVSVAALTEAMLAPMDVVDRDDASPSEARDPSSLAFDESTPLAATAAVQRVAQPDVLHDLADPLEPAIEPEPDAAADTAGAAAGAGSAPPSGAGAAPPTAAPAWPPAGDRGVVARPAPRTPAGAYLPPSAVLPPLDAPPVAAPAAPAAAPGTPWSSRASTALGDALSGLRLTADGSRRAVVLGAGIVVLGMLLPWLNGPVNEGPFAGYLDRWGLAGPGLWLVFLAVAALGFIAGSAGPTARWPIGSVAVAAGAFVLGIVWPYLIGGAGRSVGVWIVVAGAIVLLVGGVLDRAGRHAPAAPGVPTTEAGGR